MLKSYKPGASIRTHLIIAGAVWSLVGVMLMTRGGASLVSVGKLWLILPAIVVGTLKSFFLLDKSARKNLARIERKKDGACLGGIYSVKMWLLVVFMIIMGRYLRHSSLPSELIGLVYIAIGWALFFSSRLHWQKVKNFGTKVDLTE